MKTTLRSALLASLLLCGSPLFAQTGVPGGISYQATITDETGAVIAPLPGAAIQYNITLRVFESASGDTGQKWAEVFNGVPVSNGRFSVILGRGVAAPDANNPTDLATIFDQKDRFVEISVVPTATPTAAPKVFSPRQQLLASPTALRARIAEGLAPGTLTANAILDRSLTGVVFKDGTVDPLKLGTGAVNETELNFLDGVTSGLQDQLNSKAPLANPTFAGNVSASGNVNGTSVSSNGAIRAARSVVVDSENTNNGTFLPGLRFGNDSGEGISSRRIPGDIKTKGLSFFTDNFERMIIHQQGQVNIGGELNRIGALNIKGRLDPEIFNSYFVLAGPPTGYSNHLLLGPANNLNIGIYCNGTTVSDEFLAVSDERIKNISDQSLSEKDLAVLNEIEITDYTFIDKIAKGSGHEKKVIAQQVEKVFPQAVSKTTNVVPDIYKNATVKDGWVTLATDLKKGEKVKLMTPVEEGVYEVLEVKEGQFRTAMVDDQNDVFVYGREVDDFRSVDYDAIAMLNVSATQELHRRLEGKTKEIEEMKKEMAALKGLVSNLQKKDEIREARMIAIENLLTNDSKSVKTVSK